jgi:hypothetical protein
MSAPKSRENPQNVNSEVDICLKLQVFSGLPDRSRHLHRIRLLQVGERCDLLDTLSKWAQSCPGDYKSIVNKLNRIAENEVLPRLSTIKRVGQDHQIVQVAADNARLYGFQDSDNSYTFVCVNTFWIGSGNRKRTRIRPFRRPEI